MNRFNLKSLIIFLSTAIIYLLLAKAGQSFNSSLNAASPIWPASGFALGMGLLFGEVSYLGLFFGALLSNFKGHDPLLNIFWVSIANTLEAYLGVVLIKFFSAREYKVKYIFRSMEFMFASLIATIAGASLAVLSLVVAKIIPLKIASSVWLTWWGGDFVGVLIVTPFFLNLKIDQLNLKNFPWLKVFYEILFWAFLTILLYFVFKEITTVMIIFIVFPILLFSNFKFSPITVNAIVISVSSLLVFRVIDGNQFLFGRSINESLVNIQLFVSAIALSANFLIENKKRKVLKHTSISLGIGWIISAVLFYSS